MIYKYGTKALRPGKGWTDNNGVQHPSNWNTWSAQEMTEHGITVTARQTPPDRRFYTFTENPDGSYNSNERNLQDLKNAAIKKVIRASKSLLEPTDWIITRASEDKITLRIPPRNPSSAVLVYREAVRTRSNQLVASITAITTMAQYKTFADADENWPTPVET